MVYLLFLSCVVVSALFTFFIIRRRKQKPIPYATLDRVTRRRIARYDQRVYQKAYPPAKGWKRFPLGRFVTARDDLTSRIEEKK